MSIKAFAVPDSDDKSQRWDTTPDNNTKPHPRTAKDIEPIKEINDPEEGLKRFQDYAAITPLMRPLTVDVSFQTVASLSASIL